MEEEDQREERDYLLSLYIHTPTTPTPRCLYSVAHHTHTLPLDTHPHHLPDLVFWHSCVVIHLLSTSHAHVCDRNLAACGARALGSVRGRARAARRCGFGPSARCPGGRPRRGCGTGRQQEILSVIRDAAYRGGITLSCICSPHHDAPGAACFPAPPGARAPAFRSVARVRSSTSPSAAPSRPPGPFPCLPSPLALPARPALPSPFPVRPRAFRVRAALPRRPLRARRIRVRRLVRVRARTRPMATVARAPGGRASRAPAPLARAVARRVRSRRHRVPRAPSITRAAAGGRPLPSVLAAAATRPQPVGAPGAGGGPPRRRAER